MLFVTNHPKKNGRKTKIGEPYEFNHQEEASQSVYFVQRTAEKGTIEIGSEAFLQKLKDSDKDEILVYFHGFNVQPESGLNHTRKMQKFFNDMNLSVKVIPFIWPNGDKKGIVRDYFDDQDSANISAYAYARVLAKFMAWRNKNDEQGDPCYKRINVLAHSMGNRVLRNALHYWQVNFADVANPPYLFRNTFMVAADVANHTLEKGRKGHLVTEASQNVSVYYAHDDNALRGSKVANVRHGILTRRLGHTGPEDFKKHVRELPDNIYSINCSDVNTDYDRPLGHSYFIDKRGNGRPNKVFRHIAHALKTGKVKANETNYWEIEN